jgi:hypothetical protein
MKIRMSHIVSYLIDKGVRREVWEPLVELCTGEEIGGLISTREEWMPDHRSVLERMRRKKLVETAWNSASPSHRVN